MSNLTKEERKINRVYHPLTENLYSHRFFQDLSTGFSFTLSANVGRHDFFSFEPKGSEVEKLLKAKSYYDVSYNIEQTIGGILYSLMVYGIAYIYINPEYVTIIANEENGEAEERKITSLEIREIKGIVKKRTNDKILFCIKGFSGKVDERELIRTGLVTLSIQKFGFRKKYFSKVIKKLGKHDISSSSMMIISENTEGYDFNVHSRRNKLVTYKITKKIGWTFGNDGLSDSYILYKKIQQDKFKIKAVKYIVAKINEGINKCLNNENDGKLIAHIREINYDKTWKEYQEGKITVTELTNMLYKVQ